MRSLPVSPRLPIVSTQLSLRSILQRLRQLRRKEVLRGPWRGRAFLSIHSDMRAHFCYGHHAKPSTPACHDTRHPGRDRFIAARRSDGRSFQRRTRMVLVSHATTTAKDPPTSSTTACPCASQGKSKAGQASHRPFLRAVDPEVSEEIHDRGYQRSYAKEHGNLHAHQQGHVQ